MEKRSRFFLCARAIQWQQNPKGREDHGKDRDFTTVWRAGAVSVWNGPDERGTAAGSGGAAAAGIGSPDPHPADRGAGRDSGHGSGAKQLGHHGHGHWVCQRRAAGAAPGGGSHLWGQHRHHGHGPAAGIPGGGNAGAGAVRGLFSLCSGPDKAGAADGDGGVFIRAALCGDGADPERGGAAGPPPGV